MIKKYGGIDGGQAIEDVQEAIIVGEENPPVAKTTSNRGIFFGLIVYVLVTTLVMSLILTATGLSELMIAQKVPLVAYFAVLFLPTILLFLRIIYNVFKRRRKQT